MVSSNNCTSALSSTSTSTKKQITFQFSYAPDLSKGNTHSHAVPFYYQGSGCEEGGREGGQQWSVTFSRQCWPL